MRQGEQAAALGEWLRAVGTDLDPARLESLCTLAEAARCANAKARLSALRSPEEFMVRHVLDSLLVATVCPSPSSVLDIGTGLGFPGLALATVWPAVPVHLVDSRRRASVVASEIARGIGLSNVIVHCGRAGHGELVRAVGSVELLVARGFTPREKVGHVVGAHAAVCSDPLAVLYCGSAGVSEAARRDLAGSGMLWQGGHCVEVRECQWRRSFWLAARNRLPGGISEGIPLECFT